MKEELAGEVVGISDSYVTRVEWSKVGASFLKTIATYLQKLIG